MRLRRVVLAAGLAAAPAIPLTAHPAAATHCLPSATLTTAAPLTFANGETAFSIASGVGTGCAITGRLVGNCTGGTSQADGSTITMVPAMGESCLNGADTFYLVSWVP